MRMLWLEDGEIQEGSVWEAAMAGLLTTSWVT